MKCTGPFYDQKIYFTMINMELLTFESTNQYKKQQQSKILTFSILELYYKVNNKKISIHENFLMTQKQNQKVLFDQIRNKYPQRLTKLSVKEELLQKCIQIIYKDEFQTIESKYKTVSKTKVIERNGKVLDQGINELTNLGNKTKQRMNDLIYEAIKIIVKAYEKNTSINQLYNYFTVQQMVQKTKVTFKDLLQTSKEIDKCNVGQKSFQLKQNKNMQSVEKIQEIIQKQTPVSENNISKGENQQSIKQPIAVSILQNNNTPSIMKNIPYIINDIQKETQQVTTNPTEKEKQQQKQKQLQNHHNSIPDMIKIQQKQVSINSVENSQQQELISEQQISAQEQQQDKKQTKYIIPENKRSEQRKLIVTEVKNKLHLPSFKLSIQRPVVKKSAIESILTNPFIKKAFSHLCKQSYIGGGRTFDQIAQSADIMTLNKWMVFCKQFDFLSKLKKKHLVDIFHQVTSNMSQMNQQQFLNALIIIQNKLKINEQDFIHKNMCLDSEFAYRQKIASFKISYAGSKQNSFQQAMLKPIDKYYINLKQSKYQQQKKKQKQILLCQGKFKQQIQNQLMDRKQQRQLRRSRMINSLVININNNKDSKLNNAKRILSGSVDLKNNMKNQPIKSPYLNYVQNRINNRKNQTSFSRYGDEDLKSSKLQITRKIEPISYSEIFTYKNSTSTRAFTTEKPHSKLLIEDHNQSKTINNMQNKDQTNQQLSKINFNINKETQESNQKIKYYQTTQRKPEKAQQLRPQRQWIEQVKNWSHEFDKSSSEQSDEILKEHLKRQKLLQIDHPENMQLSKIMQQFHRDQQCLQPNEKQDFHSQWDRVTQLQTTNRKSSLK